MVSIRGPVVFSVYAHARALSTYFSATKVDVLPYSHTVEPSDYVLSIGLLTT